MRARRIPLCESFFVDLKFCLLLEKGMNLGLNSFSFSCLGTSASGRVYFSFLHAPFVSKMAVVKGPPPLFFLHVDWRCNHSVLVGFEPVHIFRILQNSPASMFLSQPPVLRRLR